MRSLRLDARLLPTFPIHRFAESNFLTAAGFVLLLPPFLLATTEFLLGRLGSR